MIKIDKLNVQPPDFPEFDWVIEKLLNLSAKLDEVIDYINKEKA